MNCSQLYCCFEIICRQRTSSCRPPLADYINTPLFGMHWSSLQQFLFPLKADLICIATDAFCHKGTNSYSFPPLSVDTVGPLRNVPPWASGKPVLLLLLLFLLYLLPLWSSFTLFSPWRLACPMLLFSAPSLLISRSRGAEWCHKRCGQGREDRSGETVVFKYSETQSQSQQTSTALKAVHPPLPKASSPGPLDLSIIKQLFDSLTPLEVNIWRSKIIS